MESPKILTCLATHVGRVRKNNEDAVAEDRDLGLLVLADGMGGHQAGEVASGIAVSDIVQIIRDRSPLEFLDSAARLRLLETALQTAHARIHDTARQRPECNGMGTTVIACLIGTASLHIAHVGDSRMYRWRAGVLTQITRDHSLLQELIDLHGYSREEAMRTVQRNVLTRALGVGQGLKIDLAEESIEPGDLFLLCSDGLTDMVPDSGIASLLGESRDVETLAQKLIEAALEAGGVDNVSVALAQIDSGGRRRPQAWRRLAGLLRKPTRGPAA